MRLINYTPSRANKLARLAVPPLTAPFEISICWMRILNETNGKKQISTKAHSHSFFELHIVLDGQITYRTGENLICKLTEGDAILFAPEQTHTVTDFSQNLTKFSLTFLPARDSLFYAGLCNEGPHSFHTNKRIEDALDTILAETDLKSAFSMPTIQSRILDIFYEISRSTAIREAYPTANYISDDIRIACVKQYIRDNPNILFTCTEVAKQCHFNVKYLNRIFKEQTGMTLLSYIHREKIHNAEELLTKSGENLDTISRQLGFANVYYFSNFFKRCTGLTPGEYRKLNKNRMI